MSVITEYPYPKLIIKSAVDMTGILYSRGWRQIIYLDGELTQPQYSYSEKGKENNLGMFVANIKNWQKVIQVTIPVHDSLYLAIETAAMCNNLELVDTLGFRYPVIDLNIDVTWAKSGFGKATLKMVIDQEEWEASIGDMNKGVDPMDKRGLLPFKNISDGEIEFYMGDTYSDPWAIGTTFTEGDIGKLYLIGVGLDGRRIINGRIVELSSTGWIDRSELQEVGTLYGQTIAGKKWYLMPGGMFFESPNTVSLSSISGFDYQLNGWTIPGTFVQPYYSVDNINWIAIGAPLTSNDFNASGVVITLPNAGDYYVNIMCYTHQHEYGMAVDPLQTHPS